MRCAVLGSPIGHSLSPTLHRAAYAELGLDWTYDRFEVTEDRLAGFVAGLDGPWRGLSVTMPLKVAVADVLATAGTLWIAIEVVPGELVRGAPPATGGQAP